MPAFVSTIRATTMGEPMPQLSLEELRKLAREQIAAGRFPATTKPEGVATATSDSAAFGRRFVCEQRERIAVVEARYTKISRRPISEVASEVLPSPIPWQRCTAWLRWPFRGLFQRSDSCGAQARTTDLPDAK